MILATGATSVSLDIQIVDDSGLPVTALVAATFPAVSWSLAGPTAATAITLSDLAAITTAYTSGGVKERSNGYYRLDVPNAAFASAGEVKLFAEATGKHLLCEPIVVSLPKTAATLNATDVTGNLPADLQTIKTQTVTCAAGVTIGTVVSSLTQTQVTGGAYPLATDGSGNVKISSGTGAGQLSLTSGVVDANAVKMSGTALTGRDIGASVLLSSGTGTGQISLASGVVSSNLTQIDGVTTLSGNAVLSLKALNLINTVDSNAALNVQNTFGTGGRAAQFLSSGSQAASFETSVASSTTGAIRLQSPSGIGITAGSAAAGGILSNGLTGGIATGTARAGTASTIQLATVASSVDGAYVGDFITPWSGTGAGLGGRRITSYTGATRTATVDRPWVTAPDATTVYVVADGDGPAVDANLHVDLVDSPNGWAIAAIQNGLMLAGPVTLATTQPNYAPAKKTDFLFDGSNNVKSTPQTQVVLASNGLDQIATTTSGAPSTWKFPQWIMWIARRLVRTTYDSNAQTMVTKDAAGTTISTQTATNAAGVQATGELS